MNEKFLKKLVAKSICDWSMDTRTPMTENALNTFVDEHGLNLLKQVYAQAMDDVRKYCDDKGSRWKGSHDLFDSGQEHAYEDVSIMCETRAEELMKEIVASCEYVDKHEG